MVAALPVLDRGEVARTFFVERQVPFQGLLSYLDLGIEPVGPAEATAAR